MASGGFGYASASVTYHSADFGTVYAWAYALHVARVTAFLQASYRAYELSGGAMLSSGSWTSESPASRGSGYDELAENIEYDPSGHPGSTTTVFIQDVFGSADTSNPAFVSVFQNPDSNTQYAIITSKGYHNNSSWIGDSSKGFYIPNSKTLSNGYQKRLPITFAHAFGANSISSFEDSGDLDQGTLTTGELPVCPSYGLYASTTTGSTYTSGETSILNYPTENRTYTFGYAIKDVVIEGFFKNSSYPSGTGSAWDISGAIFDGDAGYDSGAGTFSGTCFGYYSPYVQLQDYGTRSLSDYYYWNGNGANVDCLNSQQKSYSQALLSMGASFACNPACFPGYVPLRSVSTIGNKLTWSAACLAFTMSAGYDGTRNMPSIDGNGNSVKGYFRDDVLRFVSIFATRLGGTTYQSGNFIAMNCGGNIGFELGVLLGWDGSNTNDIL